ncbi:MAG: type I 3-dehydroquinate dehydratase [Candidatus Magnetominusculus sp. LBB02]|nr:type I 3-dehydroquinate dehydratase [Candidatus Magnetominusculus sp. LBB02]
MPQITMGTLTLSPQERPLIAVPLTDADVLSVQTLQAADIAELRIDMFKDLRKPYVKEIFHIFRDKFQGVAVIATCRSKEEGGVADISDEDRAGLFANVIDYADALDIEVESDISPEIGAFVNRLGKTLIASYHNFFQIPDANKLEAVYEQGMQIGATIVKIAATPNTMDDIKRLTAFTLSHDSVVTIAMGEKGMASRVFLPFAGSLFTFAYLETVTAPGQMSVDELRTFYSAFDGEATLLW